MEAKQPIKRQNNSLIYYLVTFIITFFSMLGYTKADLSDSIATLVLFIIITTFLCAGIGWWQKRQEK